MSGLGAVAQGASGIMGGMGALGGASAIRDIFGGGSQVQEPGMMGAAGI